MTSGSVHIQHRMLVGVETGDQEINGRAMRDTGTSHNGIVLIVSNSTRAHMDEDRETRSH